MRGGDDALALDAAHVGIDPRSGSNGGLRWNGTRLRQSLQRLPVDARHDLARDPRIAHERVRECAARQRPALAGQHRAEEALAVELLVDPQHQALARLAEQEAVGARDVHERRDVEALRGAEAHAAVPVELARRAQQIGPALPERVVHLGHDAGQRVVGVAHEIERDGIEDVPERARVREQLDAPVGHG